MFRYSWPVSSKQSASKEEINLDDIPNNKGFVRKSIDHIEIEEESRNEQKKVISEVEFSVTTAFQGTAVVKANIFCFDHKTKFVISDIDGTITKSDLFGHIFPLFGKDWSYDGVAKLFQNGFTLPSGPLLISPDGLFNALYREVIIRRPEDFKIEFLKHIRSLFPNKNSFCAGFGNRKSDELSYDAVEIPETHIFTINTHGVIVQKPICSVLATSYKDLDKLVNQKFPPIPPTSESNE
ncbi:unnamed protein product [Rotaria sp. Silwood1]|nr:unnamed protein product [Rotaria sp. Silwood1]CAF1633210.1 unnamed protein product [Rotaria sp. Silwood1]CAF3839785.1 unnamed protein product [Rotaria sp. Silwood1]CAF3848968.1 unnamed protein product [Rotaria sp. Silwood1]CAF4890825.1 unnamed protein product [Rotaria sp. Silwood1]